MSKIKFPFEVKYRGKYCTANIPFEFETKDIDELVAIGGVIVEESNVTTPKKSKSYRKYNTCKQK